MMEINDEDYFGYYEAKKDTETPVRSYFFKNYFLRFQITYSGLRQGMTIGFNGAIMTGTYKEHFHAQTDYKSIYFIDGTSPDPDPDPDPDYESYKNNTSFTTIKTNIFLYHDFDSYVAIRVFCDYTYSLYKYEFFEKTGKKIRHSIGYGGSFEFVF